MCVCVCVCVCVYQKLCVGYDTVILSCLVSNVYFNCIVQNSLYQNMDIGTMWHCVLFSCTPSFWYALFRYWVFLCAPFIISFVEFYFIIIFIMIVKAIMRGFYGHFFNFNYIFRLFVSKYFWYFWQLPGCFHPWTFSLNNGLNMLPLDSFMSWLYSLFGYSTGEFQALQLIVLVCCVVY